jgi:hypothetical protein
MRRMRAAFTLVDVMALVSGGRVHVSDLCFPYYSYGIIMKAVTCTSCSDTLVTSSAGATYRFAFTMLRRKKRVQWSSWMASFLDGTSRMTSRHRPTISLLVPTCRKRSGCAGMPGATVDLPDVAVGTYGHACGSGSIITIDLSFTPPTKPYRYGLVAEALCLRSG